MNNPPDILYYTPPPDASDALIRAAQAGNSATSLQEDAARQLMKSGEFRKGVAPRPTAAGKAILNRTGDMQNPEYLAGWKIFCANMINFYCDNPEYAEVFSPETVTTRLGLDEIVRIYRYAPSILEADEYLEAAMDRFSDTQQVLESKTQRIGLPGGSPPRLTL